ncbi:unnamed protein product [Hymenolepis diminuta]|uniref:Uncharacterized protein n=1 Tax=Hymenolepis diminuta TaxID=6216 RepID=A0A564YE59_HYMDI|nr:unnamed protein product [Hymenolepis diminuta]
MSKHVHRFPLFSMTASLHIRGTSALMLWRGLSLQHTLVSYGLLRFLPISSLPQHVALSLVVASLNTFWSTQPLVFCFTIVVSSYSNSYELVTVIAVVIC